MLVETAQLLQSAVISSQLLDLNSLCINSGQSVWCVLVDLTCLDYDGNLLDSCMAAISLALRRLRFPSTAVDPKTGQVVIVKPSEDPAADEEILQKLPPIAGYKPGARLVTNHLLVATSFGVSPLRTSSAVHCPSVRSSIRSLHRMLSVPVHSSCGIRGHFPWIR